MKVIHLHHHHFHHGEHDYQDEWKGNFVKREDPKKRSAGYKGVNPDEYLKH